jgi:hypothetical protein
VFLRMFYRSYKKTILMSSNVITILFITTKRFCALCIFSFLYNVTCTVNVCVMSSDDFKVYFLFNKFSFKITFMECIPASIKLEFCICYICSFIIDSSDIYMWHIQL